MHFSADPMWFEYIKAEGTYNGGANKHFGFF